MHEHDYTDRTDRLVHHAGSVPVRTYV